MARQLGWCRFVPSIMYHHVLMGVILVSTVLSSILLAGASGENLKDIYLVSFSFSNNVSPASNATVPSNSNTTYLSTDDTKLEVRVGYFGMCLSSSDQWVCSSSSRALESFAGTESEDDRDPSQLIYAAKKFKDEVVFKGLLIVSIILAFFTFLLLGTLPGWHGGEDSEGSHREAKPFPSRPVTYVALACVLFSAIIALLAAFWQHISSSAALVMGAVFTRGDITGHVGAGAMALGWVLVSLLFLVSLALFFMILSIWVVSQMRD